MSRSGPGSTSIYETPLRSYKQPPPADTTTHQTPPTASPDRNLRTSRQQGHTTQSRTQHLTIEISRKSNRSPYNPKEVLEQLYARYDNLSAQELMEVIATYEAQIEDLKLYIYRADLLDRSKIGEIFGFGDLYNSNEKVLESRQVLSELSQKIKNLLKENSALKQQNTRLLISREIPTFRTPNQDHLLIKQNQKLRALIDEYKSSQDKEMISLRRQAHKLTAENEQLAAQLGKYRDRIDAMEEVAKYKQSKSAANLEKQQEAADKVKNTQRKQPIVPAIKPIKEPYQSARSSGSDAEYAKIELTKQLHEFQLQTKDKLKKYSQLVQELGLKLRNAEGRLQQYERQRRMKIESTVRKSMLLTQSVIRHIGDVDVDMALQPESHVNKSETKPRESKIVTQIKKQKQDQGVNTNAQEPITTFRPASIVRQQLQEPDHTRCRDIENDFKQELRLLEDGLEMERMKNKNLQEENSGLKKLRAEEQRKLMARVESNIKLENELRVLQKTRDQLGKKLKDYQKQINDLNRVIQQLRDKVDKNAESKNQSVKLSSINQQLMIRISNLQDDLARARNEKNEIEHQLEQTKLKPDIEYEVKLIRDTLQQCEVSNFELFFNEFNEILRQRKLLISTVQGYRNATNPVNQKKAEISINKLKQDRERGILQQKINELIDENKRLLAKISDMEAELQSYHEEVISTEIQKLNSLQLETLNNPNGLTALEWQRGLRSCIERSLTRLDQLEQKIAHSDNSKRVQSTKEKEVEKRVFIEVSQVKSLGTK